MLIRQVNKDEVFSIKVEGSPSTGYDWKITVNEGVKVVSTQLIDPDAHLPFNERPVGGKVVTVYNFRPEVTGEFLIRFAYFRAWEKNRDPQRTYEEKIIVV